MSLLPSILAGFFSLIKQFLLYFVGRSAGKKAQELENLKEESKSRDKARKVHVRVRIDGKYRNSVRKFFKK